MGFSMPSPSDAVQQLAPGPPWPVSGFRLRARLGFSIPILLSRPARRYPRFRIQRPSSERRGDFHPHDSRAAQRTLRAAPSLGGASLLSASPFGLEPDGAAPGRSLSLVRATPLARSSPSAPPQSSVLSSSCSAPFNAIRNRLPPTKPPIPKSGATLTLELDDDIARHCGAWLCGLSTGNDGHAAPAA